MYIRRPVFAAILIFAILLSFPGTDAAQASSNATVNLRERVETTPLNDGTDSADPAAATTAAAGTEPLDINETGIVRVRTSLNIRTSPWGRIIGSFYEGDRVEIIGTQGDWYKIRYQGRIAYVHRNYVETPSNPAGQVPVNYPSAPSSPSASSASSASSSSPVSTTPDSGALAAYQGGRLAPAEFVRLFGPVARESMKKTGVPASIVLAQAALETGWGKSSIKDAKNLFGIKGTGPAGSVTIPTREWVNGRFITVRAAFRKYHSWQQSIDDHGALLQKSRYARCMAVRNDPDQFARELQKAGYATDPQYPQKLISIMKSHNLYQYNNI